MKSIVLIGAAILGACSAPAAKTPPAGPQTMARSAPADSISLLGADNGWAATLAFPAKAPCPPPLTTIVFVAQDGDGSPFQGASDGTANTYGTTGSTFSAGMMRVAAFINSGNGYSNAGFAANTPIIAQFANAKAAHYAIAACVSGLKPTGPEGIAGPGASGIDANPAIVPPPVNKPNDPVFVYTLINGGTDDSFVESPGYRTLAREAGFIVSYTHSATTPAGGGKYPVAPYRATDATASRDWITQSMPYIALQP